MMRIIKSIIALFVGMPMMVLPAVAGIHMTPVIERVLQNGFPVQFTTLASVTDSLFREYKMTGNSGSLVFYSWGMLRQADYFLNINNLVKASEYAKTGFFYLDEAVDSNENKVLIRYLRARVDAYLPAKLGRCVITIEDTAQLLQEQEKLSPDIVKSTYQMRWRALHTCKMFDEEKRLLIQLKQQYPGIEMTYSDNESPAWNMAEISQVILPIIKGD